MTLSWDLFIVLFFVILTVYGLLIGRGRIFNILINVYVAFAIASELGESAFNSLSGLNSLAHSVSISIFGVKLLIFALVITILTLRNELVGGSYDNTSKLYTAIYGFLTAGLALYSVFSFMGESGRYSLFQSSQLAVNVYSYNVVWLAGPIVVIVASYLLRRFAR